MRIALVSVAAFVGTLAGIAAIPSASADAARPACADSNGARRGGVVYVRDGVALRCDVSRPQRLAVTRVRSLAACDDMGGRYSPAVDICWDVDY